jgi:hypothetical protein
MTDLITTILTTTIEHAPGTTAVVAAYKAAKPFLAKILGPGAEEIGEIGRNYIKGRRAKNAERTLSDADKLVANTGREPQPVPLDILVPLLEAASLRDESSMATYWATLLANAADPVQRAAVQPAYINLLRQLTPIDARVLDYIYRNRQRITPNSGMQELLIKAAQLITDLEMPLIELGVSLDNLQRLWLCARPNTWGGSVSLNTGDEEYALLPTILGQAFYDAVTPPTP